MLIAATENATGRTRSRIKEHSNGDTAHDLRIVNERTLDIFDGRVCCFFRCTCGWYGWLPNNEWHRKK